MSQTNYCANCEAQDRPTHYEGGTVCRTCYICADLQFATHHIRAHQPGMFTILDSDLVDARTFAHRIINQGNQGGIVAGSTKLHQQRGTAMLFIEGGSRPMGSCLPAEDSTRAIADQVASQQVYQDVPHGDRENKASGQGTGASQGTQGAAPRTNPYQPKAGTQAITNPYSLDEQRAFGNAIATAAHAIPEAARALAEGTSYEPKPPMFELDIQRAGAFPETLHIANRIVPEGQAPILATREVQLGPETNTASSRRPGD